ncbi:SPW repeat protein [Actinoplanes sp. NPDC049596]|uniref:SPW repeat protein n=1 Tax=unclassified Actinoplanes TaxID=2626549 RepID=UPI0034266024
MTSTTRQRTADLVRTPTVFLALAGVWIALTPLFAPDLEAYAAWNDVATGVTIAVLGTLRALAPLRTAPLSIVSAALGLWLVAAPFVLGYGHHPAVAWNSIVVGILVMMFSGVGLATLSQRPQP